MVHDGVSQATAGAPPDSRDVNARWPGTSLIRLPRAAVLAAADARVHAGLLGDYLAVLASAAHTGRRLSRDELDQFRALGQVAAEHGVRLPALVDLYLSATWRAWPALPAVRAADRAAREATRELVGGHSREINTNSPTTRPARDPASRPAATGRGEAGFSPYAARSPQPARTAHISYSPQPVHSAPWPKAARAPLTPPAQADPAAPPEADSPGPPRGAEGALSAWDAAQAVSQSVDALARTKAAASAVLRASDDAVAAVCEGYEAALQARARSEEALRRELVDDLLTGTGEVGPLLERASGFGLHLEAPHVVIAAAGSRRFVDGGRLTRSVEAVLRSVCTTEPLVATKDGLLVCVVPQESDLIAGWHGGVGIGGVGIGIGGEADSGEQTPAQGRRKGRRRADERDAADNGFAPLGPPATARGSAPPGRRQPAAATQRPSRPLDPASAAMKAVTDRLGREEKMSWRIGVSRARTGVAGVRIGFEEARGAVELATRLCLDGRVVRADDLLIYKVLLRDREPLDDLVDAVLTPLRSARGGASPLLDTLDAYFATGGVALAAARRLHLSVRALTYRLDRIHTLTGYDPTSPTDRYVLQTAVLGARLINWDASPALPTDRPPRRRPGHSPQP